MSTRKFSVGDRVRVNCPSVVFHGMETTVLSGLTGPFHEYGRPFYGYMVDIDWLHPDGTKAAFEPHELVPLYDGQETVSWEQCAWQPASLETREKM